MKSITVSAAGQEESEGDLPVWTTEILPLWKDSLQEAFDKMAIFKDDAKKKVSLLVKVTKLDRSFSSTDVAARYEIRDRSDGAILYTTEVSSVGESDSEWDGRTRFIQAMNRAVQGNISKFLTQLETVDINKPMLSATGANK
jgi:hypothetical protein